MHINCRLRLAPKFFSYLLFIETSNLYNHDPNVDYIQGVNFCRNNYGLLDNGMDLFGKYLVVQLQRKLDIFGDQGGLNKNLYRTSLVKYSISWWTTVCILINLSWTEISNFDLIDFQFWFWVNKNLLLYEASDLCKKIMASIILL